MPHAVIVSRPLETFLARLSQAAVVNGRRELDDEAADGPP